MGVPHVVALGENMYYYKVVRKVNGELRSLLAPGVFNCRFAFGKTTEPLPHTLGLFAFNRHEDVLQWLSDSPGLKEDEALLGGYGFPVGKADLVCPFQDRAELMRLWYRNPRKWVEAARGSILLMHYTPDTEYDQDFRVLSTLRT